MQSSHGVMVNQFQTPGKLQSLNPPMGFTATHAEGDVDNNEGWFELPFELTDKAAEDFRKTTLSGGSLHLWRKASLVFHVCNRMRLVLQSIKPIDPETATQTVSQIKCLLSSPPSSETLEVPVPNRSSFGSTSTYESDHSQSWIESSSVTAFYVPQCSRTLSGKLRIVLESVEPVQQGNEVQIANELCSRICAATAKIELVNPSPMICEKTSVNPEFEKLVSFLFDDDQGQFAIDDVPGLVGSSDSASGYTIPSMGDAAQIGILHPSTSDTTMSAHRAVHLLPMTIPGVHMISKDVSMEVVQCSSFTPTSSYRTPHDSYQTASENISRLEADDAIESGRPDEECYQYPDSIPQMRLRTDQESRQSTEEVLEHWQKELIQTIQGKFEKIDEASDRSKLQKLQTDASTVASKLRTAIHKFGSKFKSMIETLLKDIRSKSLQQYSNAGQQQLLLKGITSLTERFQIVALNALNDETVVVFKKLDQLVKALDFRGLSASKIAQECASVVEPVVRSFSAEKRLNFVPMVNLRKL